MTAKSELAPTPVKDEKVLRKCREALNDWSKKFRFAPTRKLGDDGRFVSASLYHAYSLRVSTRFAQRKFELGNGGTPHNKPVSIAQYDLWNVPGAPTGGDFDLELGDTCHVETCEECKGQGKHACTRCGGKGKTTCFKCDGKRETECSECNGKRNIDCPRCNGSGRIHENIPEPSRNGLGNGVRQENRKKSESRDSDCHGKAWITDKRSLQCPDCKDGKLPCPDCKGTGHVTCPECGGRGKLICDECDGSGSVVCGHCKGRGWNSLAWHLVQKRVTDFFQLDYQDPGLPEKLQIKKPTGYPTTQIFKQSIGNGGEPPHKSLSDFNARFLPEIKRKWEDSIAKSDGKADIRLLRQKAELVKYDMAIRYEYAFEGKNYIVWIDLTKGDVFETGKQSLMKEWEEKLRSEGARAASKNPQKAVYNYCMAYANAPYDDGLIRRIRSQLDLGAWLFRLTAGLTGGCLWSIFMQAHGAAPWCGWAIVGSMVLLDILLQQKRIWLQIVALGYLFSIIAYLLPSLYSSLIALDAYLPAYLTNSVLMFAGASLLFANDFALRIRGGVLVFPILGALVGASTAPSTYLDFAKNPESVVQITGVIAIGLCCIAVLRTWHRLWIQNGERFLHKMPDGAVRLAISLLKPRRWPIALHALVFIAVGCVWFMYAGPGVSIERKALAARHFFQNKITWEKGRHYLAEAVDAGYVPAISLLAEAQIRGAFGYDENPRNGYALAVQAGDLGDAKAWKLQGFCAEYGRGRSQNLTEANALYAKAIELGDTKAIPLKQYTDHIAKIWEPAYKADNDARYDLALCYANGDGIAKNPEIARRWLLMAADAGHVQSQILVSEWLLKGIGGAKKIEASLKYCEMAARQEAPTALATLGYYYLAGKIVPQDYPKAIENLKLGCDKGSARAAYMLGCCYRNGRGVLPDPARAFDYFKVADRRKSLPAAYALGVIYENGDGVLLDYTDALDCYTRASSEEWQDPLTGNTTANAREGRERISEIGTYWKSADRYNDADAQYHVGLCFANGTGVAKNPYKAYTWYSKSAKQGYTPGIVQVADALYNGDGVPRDREAAAQAYEKGHQAGDVHSTYMLGMAYGNGIGFKRNLTTAFMLFNQAAEKKYPGASDAAKLISLPALYWEKALVQNNADAQYKLGCCFARGNCGVSRNDEKAFKLFMMAARQGDAKAMYIVALCYRDGVGTVRNIEKYKKALFAAAQKNHLASLALLGDFYRDGKLVPQNFTTSLTYYKIAISQGYVAATRSAAEIDKISQYWDAAKYGNAEAQFNLGVCYRDGIQISVSKENALKWFEKAASQGNHEAEYALAEMLSRIQPSNEALDMRIIDLLQRALAIDHTKAKTLYAKYLFEGKGIIKDCNRAIRLWEEAVRAGDLDAKCELARFHYTGHGIFNFGKDREKALKEWEEAADDGHIESAYLLGKYYSEESNYTKSDQDITKAEKYLFAAAIADHRPAMAELARLLATNRYPTDSHEGTDWLAKSKEAPRPVVVTYRTTVHDTIEDLSRQVVDDSAVDTFRAAKAALENNSRSCSFR